MKHSYFQKTILHISFFSIIIFKKVKLEKTFESKIIIYKNRNEAFIFFSNMFCIYDTKNNQNIEMGSLPLPFQHSPAAQEGYRFPESLVVVVPAQTQLKKKWLTARDTLAIKYQVKNKFPRFSSILAFFRVCWESVGPSLPTYFIQLMGKNMRYISRMERDIRALVSHFHHIFKRAHMLDLKNVMFHSYL